ncbi:secreted frizzled-related protein 2 [Clarias gariepinus]
MRCVLPALLACAAHCALALYAVYGSALSPPRRSCREIPARLALCGGMEYKRMRLPNLLGHETMDEAAQQSAPWVPLVHKHCHADTRMFLCSLFAPVCLEDVAEPIQPCRALCEGVRGACAPVMAAFGFPWPDILDCARFPPDNDLCIPLTNNTVGQVTQQVPKVCEACKVKMENENKIVHSHCNKDFILRFKVKEISYINGDAKIVPETKTIYKLSAQTDLQKEALWLRDGLECTCDEMSDINGTYLVMGQYQDGNLVITSLKRWQKVQRETKQLFRKNRKLQC